MDKSTLKELLAELPLTVELYWYLRQRNQPPAGRFKLKSLQANLPELRADGTTFARKAPRGKQIFIFATLHYWIEHAALVAVALAGQGHKVTLAYLPYGDWQKPISKFDLRRQNAYARQVLQEITPLVKVISLLDVNPLFQSLPAELNAAVDEVTLYDTQYTLQVEEATPDFPMYRLRHERNQAAARAALNWLKNHRPEGVIVPNGTIQEMGVVYRVARYLEIPAVTYEFGDQRERIWFAQDAEIMRQETDGLWEARRNQPLREDQIERVKSLFAARQQARLYENFARLWQGSPVQGGEAVRSRLGLDKRPVALLATNVLGDSLTLGRQVFSKTMGEWINRTVQYFVRRPDVQLVIRVHPGELLTHGTSMVDVVKQTVPVLPENIHLIGPQEKVNTYDLVEVADLGLVYTTTVGMEMAMSGIPVIVAGKTHYRGRGFTYDPKSWEDYSQQLESLLSKAPAFRMSQAQVDQAWHYAYCFFFEFARLFPWHLVKVWDDYKARPLSYVLGPEGQAKYAETFAYLTGERLDWAKV
jgi:Capsule polysaccharide biosynthesis protein